MLAHITQRKSIDPLVLVSSQGIMTKSPRVRRNGAPKRKKSKGGPTPLVYAEGLRALLKSKGHMKTAIINMKQSCTEKLPSHLKDFLTRLWHRYEIGSINLQGRATPVRARKVSDALAKNAATYFAEGRQGMSGWRPFQTAQQVGTFPNFWTCSIFLKISNFFYSNRSFFLKLFVLLQAVKEHAGLQEIKRTTGVTDEHLWRRAQEVEPRLGSVRVLFKRYRGPKIRDERLRLAKALFQRSADDFMSATYVDEATIHIRKPPVTKGIALKGEHLISEIPLAIAAGMPDLPKDACGKLSFMLAVHPKAGLVLFDFLSPTDGHKMAGRYKVSPHLLLIFFFLYE